MQYFKQTTKIKNYVQMPVGVLLGDYSPLAKILYALLLYRTMLSRKNGWEENGNVFVIYPIKNMAKDIRKSERSIKTVLKELEEAGLIRRSHQGACKANHIFVLLPDDGQNDDGQGVDSRTTAGDDSALFWGRNLPPNNNRYSDIYLNNKNKNRKYYDESMYKKGEGI